MSDTPISDFLEKELREALEYFETDFDYNLCKEQTESVFKQMQKMEAALNEINSYNLEPSPAIENREWFFRKICTAMQVYARRGLKPYAQIFRKLHPRDINCPFGKSLELGDLWPSEQKKFMRMIDNFKSTDPGVFKYFARMRAMYDCIR